MYVHCVYLYGSIICLWYIVNRHLPVCSLSCHVPYTSKIFTLPSHFYVYSWLQKCQDEAEVDPALSHCRLPGVSTLVVSLSIMERHQNQVFSSETKLRFIWPCAFDSLHGQELCPSLGSEKMIVLWCQASPPLSFRLRSHPRGSPCLPPTPWQVRYLKILTSSFSTFHPFESSNIIAVNVIMQSYKFLT